MFRVLYYLIFFNSDVRNENGLKRFAERCMNNLLERAKRRSSSLREDNQELQGQLDNTRNYLDSVDRSDLLDDNEFFSIRKRIRTGTFIVIGIFITEGLLNYFSTLVFISGTDMGIALLRWLIAIVLTFGAIGSAEKLIEALLPIEKHKSTTPKVRSIPVIVLWSILVIGVELAIVGVSEARARDIEGGRSGGLLYYGFIVLSMVLPLIAGAIGWDILRFYDAYKHTRKVRRAEQRAEEIDQKIDRNLQDEADFYNITVTGYWNRFNDFRVYKENYNRRKGITENLAGHYCGGFEDFRPEADRRYGEIGGTIPHAHNKVGTSPT